MAQRTCSECGREIFYGGVGQPPKTCLECRQVRKTRIERINAAKRPERPRVIPVRAPRFRECARCSATFEVPAGRGRYLYCPNCQKCGVGECGRPRDDGNWCSMHSMRVLRSGAPGSADRLRGTGPWKSQQGWIDRKGYRRFRREDGTHVFEHTLVMERVLGRLLGADENVHHINGDKADNRPENLELWNTSQPSGQRIPDKVAFAIEILKRYAPELLA